MSDKNSNGGPVAEAETKSSKPVKKIKAEELKAHQDEVRRAIEQKLISESVRGAKDEFIKMRQAKHALLMKNAKSNFAKLREDIKLVEDELNAFDPVADINKLIPMKVLYDMHWNFFKSALQTMQNDSITVAVNVNAVLKQAMPANPQEIEMNNSMHQRASQFLMHSEDSEPSRPQ